MSDPVSWLQIEQGWQVVSSDGAPVGTVAQVAGDKQSDIFDGLAVQSDSSNVGYVPGEQVGSIVAGTVTLKLSAAAAASLAPYEEAAPQTIVRPEGGSLGDRISGWLKGRR